MYKIMTPGPTQVRDNVRSARSLLTTNPDIDPEFAEYYKDTCDMIGETIHSTGNIYIMSGEGILGLEAACASLTETGDRVLVIDNGIFGKGFGDFVKIYGGIPIYYTKSYRKPINPEELREYLKTNHNFKYATIVHCDTPSGMLNDVKEICPILNEYGILTVVDSVSASFGVPLYVDASKIDICCMGSQKVLSAPPGLTMLSVSNSAITAMEKRKTPIASFYCNILTFKNYYVQKWFPYTMPISDIMGLNKAVKNVLYDKNIIKRHHVIAEATRKAVTSAGLSLYADGGYSDTVTVINVPQSLSDKQILNTMRDEYNILIAGCFDILSGKVFRIGHMGENANVKDVAETLFALDKTFNRLNYPLKCSMSDVFMDEINKSDITL
ncbi:MAG: alanine--glyoxylate aminotransferase family protein [Candidatus Metalachnospira sp.]|nr:alanine--glyoxylate aminotransferase family protein [Candidatus Metalachnospira sp.]